MANQVSFNIDVQFTVVQLIAHFHATQISLENNFRLDLYAKQNNQMFVWLVLCFLSLALFGILRLNSLPYLRINHKNVNLSVCLSL